MTGKEMRDSRMAAGILQVEIAMELGVDNQTVCRWENSGEELRNAYAQAFEGLVQNADRVGEIKICRRRRRRKQRLAQRGLRQGAV
jgi:DNA-binding XRE family transcriptional regulator